MTKGLRQRTPTTTIIRHLRIMADAGGMLTRNRLKDINEAANRLEELDERVAIMSECEVKHDEE